MKRYLFVEDPDAALGAWCEQLEIRRWSGELMRGGSFRVSPTSIANAAKTAIKALLPDRVYQAIQFRLSHGHFPNLRNPTTFGEKVVWKKLHDRRALLTLVADKYRVREYVARRVGEHVLVRLLHATSDPTTIPFDELPDRCVGKAAHARVVGSF
jgi:hypothetical protein